MKSKFRVVEGDKKPSIFANLEPLRIVNDDENSPKEVLTPSETSEAPEAWERGVFAMWPKLWHDRLKELRNAGADLYRLVWVLLYRGNLGEKRFPVPSRMMFMAGVHRQHKRRVLEQLESGGLIRVEWRPAPQVPWVTVLHLAGRRGRRK
jgi:hypothetical protein